MAGGKIMAGVWTGAWLTATILFVCAVALVLAWDFVPATTRYFPLSVSAACVVVAVYDLARRIVLGRRRRGEGRPPAELGHLNPAADAPALVLLRYATWFFAYLAGIWVLSLIVASGLFVAAFLRFEPKVRWPAAVLSGVAVMVLVVVAGNAFNVRWPSSLLDPLAILR